MRLSDYSKWIFHEIRETKAFTVLNIIGVWISVCLVIIFLSLALGIQNATVKKITEEVDLFTLEVDPKGNESSLQYSTFSYLEKNPKVRQIIPVLTEYVNIRVAKKENDSTVLNNKNTLPLVYTENYFVGDALEQDLRTETLSFIHGRRLTAQDVKGIIISKRVLDELSTDKLFLDQTNFNKYRIELLVKRYEQGKEKYAVFSCQIIGVTKTTPHNGALVYISSAIAERIDDWLHFKEYQDIHYQDRQYERFDFVAQSLSDLESLRESFHNNDYPTSSVFDRIENVKKVLFVMKVIFFLIFGIAALIAIFNIIITLTSSVLKKKQEIGILKALGATNSQIQNIFVLHAVYLSIFASILGAVSAYILMISFKFITVSLFHFENLTDIELFSIDSVYVLLIILASILLSVFASLAPARKAASITPIETMREN